MESDNIAKFRAIVSELPEEKRNELTARMKGMSREEAMKVVNRMVAISEQRKIEITERPKVLAGNGRDTVRGGRFENAPSTEYEVTAPRKIKRDDIEIVKNPSKTESYGPAHRPIKKVEQVSAKQQPIQKVSASSTKNAQQAKVQNQKTQAQKSVASQHRVQQPQAQLKQQAQAQKLFTPWFGGASYSQKAAPKKSEPHVARAGREQAARRMEQLETERAEAEAKRAEAQIRKEKALVFAKKAGKVALVCVGRVLTVAVCTLVLVVAAFYTFLGIIMKGPSTHLRNQFVPSVMESSAGGVLAKWILTDEEIEAIMNSNTTQAVTDITDTTLVSAMAAKNAKIANAGAAVNELDPDGDGIEVHDISGPMYHGKMLVIYDPSRIMVATIDNYNHNGAGMTLGELIDKYDGVGGINGGQYEDTNGMGIGGWPEGIVISEGELRMGNPGGTYDVYGLTNENVLVVGNMTAQKALDMGVRDAVSFGPALIVNGVAANYSGCGGGLNPRTAIGQREDGAILLLVIEGRKTSSMGATMADLIDIMLEYGAVNAANLDGGMSSSMRLYDEVLVSSSSIRVDRQMPTAFIILPQKDTSTDVGAADASQSAEADAGAGAAEQTPEA